VPGSMPKDLSIVIPARNEMFLKDTVEDILKNIEADTEVIVVLDGAWAKPRLEQHPRVKIIYFNQPIGQRAATNAGVRISRAKYVMKLDAHCSFDKCFDRKMMDGFAKFGDEVTMVPIMRNLWAFDWKCHNCGKRSYQGPTPEYCEDCGKKDKIKRKMFWVGKPNPQSTSYCFDSEPHFQYFNDYKRRDEYIKAKKTGFTETMSLQGSCFMISRDKYWQWEVCDEKAGSWGNQGIEVACATWLSGGRVICNHNTWYAHLFRTQGGDFGFPYKQRGRKVKKTKDYIKDKFWNMKHPTQQLPVEWLVKKFAPVPGWK